MCCSLLRSFRPRKRQPLLPEKDKKKQKKKGLLEGGADAGKGGEGDAMLAELGEGGRRGAFGSAEDARAAAASRAELRSRKKGFGKLDTGFGNVASVANAEEEFQGEEEEKDVIEPFNLDKEREEGFYDAEGNYVEYRRDAELHVRPLPARRAIWQLGTCPLLFPGCAAIAEEIGL